jgi:hypothetical protein
MDNQSLISIHCYVVAYIICVIILLILEHLVESGSATNIKVVNFLL